MLQRVRPHSFAQSPHLALAPCALAPPSPRSRIPHSPFPGAPTPTPTLYHVYHVHPLILIPLLPLPSSIRAQTLHQNSALLSNVTSGQRTPPPFLPAQKPQIPPLPSPKIPSVRFPSLRSLPSVPKSRNPSSLMKKRAVPLGILQFPRTCPVSLSQTSRDGTTAAPPCSL